MATQSEVTQLMDTTWVRSQFPALSQTVNGHPAVFLDSPGGTQVPQSVIDAISGYLRNSNANTDGAFATSRRTDAMLADGRDPGVDQSTEKSVEPADKDVAEYVDILRRLGHRTSTPATPRPGRTRWRRTPRAVSGCRPTVTCGRSGRCAPRPAP